MWKKCHILLGIRSYSARDEQARIKGGAVGAIAPGPRDQGGPKYFLKITEKTFHHKSFKK